MSILLYSNQKILSCSIYRFHQKHPSQDHNQSNKTNKIKYLDYYIQQYFNTFILNILLTKSICRENIIPYSEFVFREISIERVTLFVKLKIKMGLELHANSPLLFSFSFMCYLRILKIIFFSLSSYIFLAYANFNTVSDPRIIYAIEVHNVIKLASPFSTLLPVHSLNKS